MKTRKQILAAGAAAFAAALAPATASAVEVPQVVSGTALETISLTAGTPAAFTTGFQPGAVDATSTLGTVTALSTDPSWTLTARDGTTNDADGTMNPTGPLCTAGDTELANPLRVTTDLAVPIPGVTSAGEKTLGSAAETVASATNTLLPLSTFNSTFRVSIPASQTMTTGCVYTMTTTYTLQG